MKLKYAKVNYNNKLIKQDGTKEVSNFHVLVDVDQFDQNTWVASTYKSFYKKANRKLYKNLQVVIESLSGDEHYYFVPKQENKIISLHKETLSTSWRKLQVFKANNNTYYYYEPSLFDDDGKFQRKFTGHSTSGSISIVKVENELGENLGTITFEPSSLTVEEYEKMLKDLYRVHLSLLSSNDSPEKIGIKGKETLEGILINIREINESIQAIINNPNRNLELEGKIQSIKLINKFEPKLAIQKLINPGKNTFYINQLSETLATSENYLIKQGLTDLLNYLKNSKVSLYQERDLIENSEEKDSNVLVSKTNIDRLNENNLCNLDYNVRPQNRLISSTSRELREFFAMNKETEERLSYNEATFEAWRFGSVLKSNFMPFSVEFKDEIQRKNDFIRTNTITSNHVLTHYLLDQFGNWLSKQSNCFQIGNSIIIIQAEIEFKNGFRKISRIYDIFINNESLARPTSEKLKQWVSEKKYYFEDPTNDLFRFKASLEQKEQYYKDQLDSVDERSVIAADGIKEIEQLLAADIFKGIKLRHRMPNVPTQLFLHNPLYLRAWKTLQEINKDIEFYVYMQEDNLKLGVLYLPDIFETWTYFKILFLLTNKMGWKLINNSELREKIISYYKDDSSSYEKQSDFENITTAILSLGKYKLVVTYEPRFHYDIFNKKENHLLTPDILFEFFIDEVKVGDAIMDAKFREYKNQNEWWEDIRDISIKKYINKLDEKIDKTYGIGKSTIKNSGIIHSDTKLDYYDYFPYDLTKCRFNKSIEDDIQKFKIESVSLGPHKLSSLPFTPNNTFVFINWIRMMMEFHFGQDKVCWMCGNIENIEKETKWTKGGAKAYHLTCQNCHEFWVSTHCKNCTEKIYKHIDNYHSTASRSKDDRWNICCPHCGDYFKKELNK